MNEIKKYICKNQTFIEPISFFKSNRGGGAKLPTKWGYFGHTLKLFLKPKLNYSAVTFTTNQNLKSVLINVKSLQILLINMHSVV